MGLSSEVSKRVLSFITRYRRCSIHVVGVIRFSKMTWVSHCETSWDLGPFAAVLIPEQRAPPAINTKKQ